MSNRSETLRATALQRTKFEGDVQASISKRHPLHDRIEPGGKVRFDPKIERTANETTLHFFVTFGDPVDPNDHRTRRTKYLASNNQHVLVWPRDLARAVGLADHADARDVSTGMTAPDGENRVGVTLDPPLTVPRVELGGGIDAVKKYLAPIPDMSDTEGRIPEKYRLRFPVDYNEVHGFDEDDDVGISVADDGGKPVIVLTPNADEDDNALTRSLQCQTVQTETSAGNLSTADQFSVNIPKVLVDFALDGNRDVRLRPEETRIIVEPA